MPDLQICSDVYPRSFCTREGLSYLYVACNGANESKDSLTDPDHYHLDAADNAMLAKANSGYRIIRIPKGIRCEVETSCHITRRPDLEIGNKITARSLL